MNTVAISHSHLNSPSPGLLRWHRTVSTSNTHNLHNLEPVAVEINALCSMLNLESMRTSTRQKIKYYLMLRFQPEQAELKLLTKIERMVAEGKQQLSTLATGSHSKLNEALGISNLAKVVIELTREIQRSHSLGKAMPWMVEGAIKIIDYGLSTKNIFDLCVGTLSFMPPEFNHKQAAYNAEKHDSFSLGISLLEQYGYGKYGRIPKNLNDAHPTSPNKMQVNEHKVMLNGQKHNVYSGFDNTLAMQGITL